MALVWNIHRQCEPPLSADTVVLTLGDFQYYHYNCDRVNDAGWGCGYRTLQSMCSWIKAVQDSQGKSTADVPSINQIQHALVTMDDKQESFCGSKEWIGTIEATLVIDHYYDVACKIIHVPSGAALADHVDTIESHFLTGGSPIMMGGDSDAAAKAICGICRAKNDSTDTYLLIVDPHYRDGGAVTTEALLERELLLWKPVNSFMHSSFYNLCLPQLKLHCSKNTDIS